MNMNIFASKSKIISCQNAWMTEKFNCFSCLKVYLINSSFLNFLKKILTCSVLIELLQNYCVMISSICFLTSVTIIAKNMQQTCFIVLLFSVN